MLCELGGMTVFGKFSPRRKREAMEFNGSVIAPFFLSKERGLLGLGSGLEDRLYKKVVADFPLVTGM